MSAQRAGDANREHLSGTIAVGFLAAVVFTALAHGAVEPWSVFVFEGMIVVLLLLWSIKVIADKRFELNIPHLALPIAALTAVGLLQSIAFTDSTGRWLSLSRNVGYTRAAVTVLVFLLISFLIAANFFSTRGRLLSLAHFLAIYGLAMALFGLVQHFTWSGKFFWLRPTEVTTPFGPFANHNHFAGYMELLIPIPIALIITRAVTTELRVLFGFAAMMMGVAAALSLSRGGIISIGAAMMFLVLMSVRLPKRRGKAAAKRGLPQLASQAAIVIAIVAVISAGILWIGADPVINRVTQGQPPSGDAQKETFFSSRGWVWRDTFTMIRANPLLGVGLGAYETAFSIYTKSDGSLRVPQAHNDYLQVAADCGVVGGLIALWFIAVVFRAVLRGARSRDPLYAGLALGSGAGVFAMLVHSLFDFNLQLPSNALLFLLLSAVAVRVGTVVGNREGSAPMAFPRDTVKLGTESVSSASLARGAIMNTTQIKRGERGMKVLRATALLIVASSTAFAVGIQTNRNQSAGVSPSGSTAQPGGRGSSSVLVSPEEDYRIGPNDVIDIQIENAPELSRVFRVTAAGTFLMPYVGRITAAKKTTEEVAQLITDSLKGDYLKDPKVTVSVKEYNSRSFFIQGSVRSPGVYQIEGRPSVLELITLASGLSDTHGANAFIIRRLKTPLPKEPESAGAAASGVRVSKEAGAGQEPAGADESPKYELKSVHLNALLRGHFDQDMFLEPGDIVNIPPTDVFFVAGEVNQPGSFPLKDGTTLRQAISLAQGTNYKAALERGVVFREGATGKREEVHIDIGAIMAGKKEDVPIMANDIIIVPNSRTKTIGGALLRAFGLSTVARLPIP